MKLFILILAYTLVSGISSIKGDASYAQYYLLTSIVQSAIAIVCWVIVAYTRSWLIFTYGCVCFIAACLLIIWINEVNFPTLELVLYDKYWSISNVMRALELALLVGGLKDAWVFIRNCRNHGFVSPYGGWIRSHHHYKG